MSKKELQVEDFVTATARDLMHMVLGAELGKGIHRGVYAWDADKSLVAKLEEGYGSFANVREWEVWQAIKMTQHAKWFAPCVEISACGIWLLQKRTEPMPANKLPTHVPAFFTDIKPENWGLLNGKPVCHDYGNHLLHELGMTSRMRKAKWD